MAILAATGNLAGQIEPIGEVHTQSKKLAVNNQAFLRGDVLALNVAGTWRKCTSGDVGPFAVCIKAKASTETVVEYFDMKDGEISVVSDGVIRPERYVKPSTSTDGQIMEHNPSTGTTTDTEDERIGKYIKRAQYVPEGDGVTATANAADGDIVIIRLL